MKKKILLLVLILFFVASASVFATGIGIQGGLDFVGTPYASNLALSLKLDDLPMMFGIGWNFQNGVAIGASADWWMYHENLVGIINLYMGPGVFGGFAIGNTNTVWVGPRVAAGLQIFPIEPLEIFVEIDPFLTLLPTIGFGFQGAIGARFWF
ncbi:MAG: hypothetical protein JEZ04_15990 [Spirochaetales bacterium]|nr:hypothetical protein [Spirochaetales bacterium]